MFFHQPTPGVNDRIIERVLEIAIVVFMAAILLATLPTMVRVPDVTDSAPRPMAAPAPLAR